MPAPQQPQRETSSAPRCNKMVQGDGIMSYTCSLPQGHEVSTSDPNDPQPCYTVESSRSARVWQNWAQREHDRTQRPAGTVIQCPTCTEPAMRVTEEGGRCENCGAVAEIQQDLDAATFIGEPMLSGDGVVAAAQHDTSERDADIIAAAKAAAPTRLDDHCLGEHDPATNLRCIMRPEPPPGYDLVEVGPSPLLDAQVPDWLLVAEGSPNPTAEQVKIASDLRNEFIAEDTDPDTGYRVRFDHDSTVVEPYSISDETMLAAVAPLGITPAPGESVEGTLMRANHLIEPVVPTKQREGDQVLPKAGVDCVQDIVIDAMIESKRVGTERYGQPLMTFNGRKGLQDIVDEARDFFVYGTMLLREGEADRDTLVEAVYKRLDAEGVVDRQENYEADLRFVAEIAVDTVMGWVIAQRAEATERQKTLALVRRALRSGPHKIDDEGSWIGIGYLIDVLDEIGRAEPAPEPARDDTFPVDGVVRIARARQHQISKGYDIEHDAHHGPEVLLQAARSLMDADPDIWPWGPTAYPGHGERLDKAGALIAAAIDARGAAEPERQDGPPLLAPISVQDLLSMVEDEFPQNLPSVDDIAQWPEEVRYAVQEWATAVHLVASDNDMEIPEMPEVLR